MKINLTISDLNETEAQALIAKITGAQPVAVNINNPVVTGAPIPAAALTPPVPPVPATGSGEGSDGEEGGESAADVTGQLDADGLPWDARIHSSNKRQKADGKWMKRRGAQEMEINAVETELRATLAAQAAYHSPSPVQALTVQVDTPQPQVLAPIPAMPGGLPPLATPQAVVDAQAANAAYAAPAASAPLPAPVPQPVAAASVISATPGRDFPGIMTRVQVACQNGRLNQDGINAIVGQVNQAYQTQLTGIVGVSTRPDLIEYVHQILDANQF